MTTSIHYTLAARLTGLFQRLPQVEAVALGGSLTSGSVVDASTDIDLYVYVTAPIPLEARQAIVDQLGGAARADMNLGFWGPGDEWFDAVTGIEVDAMYWDTRWMEEMLARVLDQCQPSMGYTTSFWFTVRTSTLLFDRGGWFARLQAAADRPYPAALRQAIIAHNRPVLRDIIPSYLHQIEKAVRRRDLVSVNHRLAALLASYFDILFAYNLVLHPGEKRLVEHAIRLCPRLPDNMPARLDAVLAHSGAGDEHLLVALNALIDELEMMLDQEA